MSYIEMKNIYKVYPPRRYCIRRGEFLPTKGRNSFSNWRKWCRKKYLDENIIWISTFIKWTDIHKWK